jgi:hypothetical protein
VSGICRTNATLEWELLHTWAVNSNLGLNWDLAGLSSLPASCPAWEGVNCDVTTSRVTSLDLSGRSFPCDGTPGGCQLLPGLFSLEGLSALKLLHLARTSFHLNLNTDLSGLILLESLDLGLMPNLAGTLDAGWPEQMPLLIELYLVGSRTGLVSFCLVSRDSGRTLETVTLAQSCNLPHRVCMVQSGVMWQTNMCIAGLLQGTIPSTWGTGWSTLTTLSISNCGLTGPVPDTIPDVLERLELPGNRLSGSLPEITTASNAASALRVLDVSNNDLQGSLPAMFGSHPGIVSVNLRGNRLTGTLPAEVRCSTLSPH